jgi:superfamily I DNA and/or RNA helicase
VGQEFDIVIVSTVKYTASKKMFRADPKKLNVAITRTKKQLFVFGSSYYLQEVEFWREILQFIWSKTIRIE